MSVNGIGGNKQFINAGEQAIQQGGAEALNTVAQGLDQASKSGKIDDSVQAFQDLPAVQTGGFETSEAGDLQPPNLYFNEADKFGVGDSKLNTYLNDPQFDVNQPLTKFAENSRFATKFDPATAARATDVVDTADATSTDSTQSSGDPLIDTYGQDYQKIQDDVAKLGTIDTSTAEGQQEYLKVQQEIQALQNMMQLIVQILNNANELNKSIIGNIR